MNKIYRINRKGITLLELLVALVISGTVIAGIYRVFVAQTRAYTVQDQVVEVQQNIRSAMEILLRDLRMAGYDSDDLNSKITIANPIVYPLSNNSITINYEYDNTHQYTVVYSIDAQAKLIRQLTITPDVGAPTATSESTLENVQALNFTYGVDTNNDGAVDTWVPAEGVGTGNIVAVRIVLTAKPDQTNPDVKEWVLQEH